tara:strand:+ start:610 stop:1206 length:597 start_codon:yes stop_codon:yes gene_type:complete
MQTESGINFFDRPTPGESLITEPKQRPYERPPEMPDLGRVLGYYLDVMFSEEFIDNIGEMLSMQAPVELIVNAITMQNVAEGKHSMQTRIIISPLLHEFIRLIGKKMDIDIIDGLNPNNSGVNERMKNAKLARELDARVETLQKNPETDDGGVELMRQTSEMLQEDSGTEDEMENEQQEEVPVEEKPMPTSLMQRRGA